MPRGQVLIFLASDAVITIRYGVISSMAHDSRSTQRSGAQPRCLVRLKNQRCSNISCTRLVGVRYYHPRRLRQIHQRVRSDITARLVFRAAGRFFLVGVQVGRGRGGCGKGNTLPAEDFQMFYV